MSGNQEWSQSDVVAEQIVRLRKRRQVTREQLAARCAELGYPALTAPALANLETGRRNSEGRRRRDVTIDEIAVIAQALNVAPLLLVYPVGERDMVEYVPGKVVDTWTAARWFAGEAYEPEDVGTTYWAVPLYLFRRHQQILALYDEARFERDLLPATDDDAAQARIRARAENALRDLRSVRAEMRRHDLTPPSLPDDLKHVDDRRHVFLAPDDVDRMRATGELRAYRVVEGRRVFADHDPATGVESWPNSDREGNTD